MPNPPNKSWSHQTIYRLLGHPAVFAVICIGFFSGAASLVYAIANRDGSEILRRFLSLLLIGFGTWAGWRAFLTRRRGKTT